MWRWVTWATCGCVFYVCSGRRYVEMCNAGVCLFRCAAGGGIWRWVTRRCAGVC